MEESLEQLSKSDSEKFWKARRQQRSLSHEMDDMETADPKPGQSRAQAPVGDSRRPDEDAAEDTGDQPTSTAPQEDALDSSVTGQPIATSLRVLRDGKGSPRPFHPSSRSQPVEFRKGGPVSNAEISVTRSEDQEKVQTPPEA